MRALKIRSTIILFILLVGILGFSQNYEYKPFPLDTAKWVTKLTHVGTVSGGDLGINIYEYFLAGDTIVDDLSYNKLYYINSAKYRQNNSAGLSIATWKGNELELIGGIREDTTGKIYFKYLNLINSIDPAFHENITFSEEEYILYDFNIEIGDTVDWIPNGEPNVVSNVDTIELFENDFRRKIIFEPTILYTPETSWIEGIGSSSGLFGAHKAYSIVHEGPVPGLLCFKSNEIKFIQHHLTPILELCNFYDGNPFPQEEEEVEEEEEEVFTNSEEYFTYPNPVVEILKIDNSQKNILDIKLFDINGRLLIEINSDLELISIDVNGFPSGIYLLKISHNENSKFLRLLKK